MAGVLAGDLFGSEDRHGTWKTVLTRSCTRRHLFAGKVLAVAVFAVGLLGLLAASSVLAGVLLVGAHPLVSLSGTLLSTGHCLALVAVAWLLCVPPMLAFVSLAVLFSVATRNGIVGVLGPAVVDLVMQLLALVGTGVWLHSLLVASAFDAWHPLFVAHPFYGPLVIGEAVSLVWIAACLGASWLLLRRRDFTGATVSRRPGWVDPGARRGGNGGGDRVHGHRQQLGPGRRHRRAVEGQHHDDLQQPDRCSSSASSAVPWRRGHG